MRMSTVIAQPVSSSREQNLRVFTQSVGLSSPCRCSAAAHRLTSHKHALWLPGAAPGYRLALVLWAAHQAITKHSAFLQPSSGTVPFSFHNLPTIMPQRKGIRWTSSPRLASISSHAIRMALLPLQLRPSQSSSRAKCYTHMTLRIINVLKSEKVYSKNIKAPKYLHEQRAQNRWACQPSGKHWFTIRTTSKTEKQQADLIKWSTTLNAWVTEWH